MALAEMREAVVVSGRWKFLVMEWSVESPVMHGKWHGGGVNGVVVVVLVVNIMEGGKYGGEIMVM